MGLLKHVADLSANFEYGLIWWGQSIARPWGTKAQGYAQAPQLDLDDVGVQLTGLSIPTGTGTETLTVTAGTLTADEWNGSTLRLGSSSAALAGYATVISNTANNLRVTWIVNAGATGAQAGYVVRENMKWASYPNVRVLTPYQPSTQDPLSRNIPYPNAAATWANGGRRFVMPGFTTSPWTGTPFSDLGCFLPFTFLEGVDSWGISDVNDGSGTGAHPWSAANATTFTWTNAPGTPPPVNFFTDGYLRVEWETGGLAKLSWARVASNTATIATLAAAGWQGDGTPSNVKRYELWIPHFNNSPWAYLPGECFTYPSAETQPLPFSASFGIGGVIHNRPRGNIGFAYDDRFGSMLQFAWRLSAAIGKRINVIALGINGASQVPANTQGTVAFPGICGWYDYHEAFDWTPSNPNGCAARLSNLIRNVAPKALLAESNTKPLRVLGIAGQQLESDSTTPEGRETVARTFRTFLDWLRAEVDAAGLNPYGNGAKLPIWHPLIASYPWNILDTGMEVRNAIGEVTAADGFACSNDVDDLARLGDLIHMTGASEAIEGARGAALLGEVIEFALGFGSTCLTHNMQAELAIANLALSHIGVSRKITSFTDGSIEADWCTTLFPQARDQLLGLRQFKFALRRVPLTKVKPPPSPLYDQYDQCYVLPPLALNSFAVLPPTVHDDYQNFSQTSDPAGGIFFDVETFARSGMSGRADIPFEIEQAPAGHQLLFTDQANATLRFVARVVDADRYPSVYAFALSLQLAAMLATSIIRGDEGEAVAARMLKKMGAYLGAAAALEANQRSTQLKHIPQHIAER